MKTTPDGLTHLINMLVDVVNLQRKAQGTPGACCDVEVEYGFADEANRVTVKVYADVNVAAAPKPVTLEEPAWQGERELAPADVIAAEQALHDIGYGEGSAKEAAATVFQALGLRVPDRDTVG